MAAMEKMEKKLARIKTTFRNRRKLSLPIFLNTFTQQIISEESPSEGSSQSTAQDSSVLAKSYSKLVEEGENVDEANHLRKKEKRLTRNLSYSNDGSTSTNSKSTIPPEKRELRRGLSITFGSSNTLRKFPVKKYRFKSAETATSFSASDGISPRRGRQSLETAKIPFHEMYKSHPQLVATVSSPGGTVFTALVVPPSQVASQSSTEITDQIENDKKDDTRESGNLSVNDTNSRPTNSCDTILGKWSEENSINGIDIQNKISAWNAKSLPHIHHLSDYEEEEVNHSNNSLPATDNLLPSDRSAATATANKPVIKSFSNSSENCFSPKSFQSKSNTKSKKSNLRRRHATREKEGRSKSLTQIDNIVESQNDMLLLGSQKVDGESGADGGKSGSSSTQQNKLGVPEEYFPRRPPLSADNKIMSGEFLTIMIDTGPGREHHEEIAVISRGVTLKDVLEGRGFDVSGMEAFQEGQRSAISLSTDTSQIGGRYIQVKVRDDAKSPIRHRSSSQTSRKPPGSRFWAGSSADDLSPLMDEKMSSSQGQDGSLKASKSSTKANNRWSLFQSNSKDSKMEELVRQLDYYSRSGIPKLPHILTCHSTDDDNELKLEEGWRVLVISSPSLNDREEQRQSAIWELIETEATYINMLKVVTDLFLACLCNLQNEGILHEIDTEKLFNNIQEVYQASLYFWRNHVCPLLEETRRTRQPMDPTCLMDGFCKFDEIFEPYTQYCLEQTNCQLYCKEHSRENNYFKAYLAWCETQKECNRLKLVDILVQPMQRITRYSILLKAVLKKTDDEIHKSYLLEMIMHVDRFVSTVNTALRNRYEQERLKEINMKIDAYDAVETRDDELATTLRLHCDLNLLQPMPGCPSHIQRWLLYRGDFRLRDAHTSKSDVHVFLFTDFLLVTKITQRKAEKLKIIRPPYRIDHLVVVELKDSSTLGFILLTEWRVASAAFTLQNNDPKVYKAFFDAISIAKKQYNDAKQSRHQVIVEAEDDVLAHIPRSPRMSSSRASRVSSLAHSHSGSMDLNETSAYVSPGGHHPPSFDLSEVRASSASSDDSFGYHQAEIQRSKSLEGQQSSNVQNERQTIFPKSPNTLSVIPPYATGQSLPNLTADPSNSLKVPTSKQLSASTRGTSYPPPSPRTLRRCPPVPQSRNPPLLKSRHVTSILGAQQQHLQKQVPEQLQQRYQQIKEHPKSGCLRTESEQEELNRRRISRVERLDNRRYHTAGAIDDIKKQDTKDTTIHKRLSWNYGQGPPPPPREHEDPNIVLAKHTNSSKSISSESVHSSSGVSSTSSLLRSEYEALENIDDDEIEDELSTVVDLSIGDPTSLKISPHISTTYICHNPDVTLGIGTSQYITQPVDESHSQLERIEDQISSKSSLPESTSKTSENLSAVQIKVNESALRRTTLRAVTPHTVSSTLFMSSPTSLSSSSSVSSSSSCFSSFSSSSFSSSISSSSSTSGAVRSAMSTAPKDDQVKELLLTDASVETSDV